MRGVFEKVPGSGVWWVRYVDADGVYHREKAGTKSQAIRLRDLRKGQALEGKLPQLRKREIPFAELVADARTYVEQNYSRPGDDLARLDLIKTWFTGSAKTVTPAQIRAALAKAAQERSWSDSTKNHHHNLICLCYRLAIESEKLKESPIHGKKVKKEKESKRVRYLTDAEEEKLREAIRSKPEWAHHEPELDLALHTGLRRTDMYVRLVWSNVDMKRRVATIPRSKNGDPVCIPLNDVAMCALHIFAARGDGNGRVVRNPQGETLSFNQFWFLPALKAAGIENYCWHDNRHTFASRLRMAGTGLATIADLLGHRQLEMTKRYAHLPVAATHREVARIANSTTVAPERVSEAPGLRYVN